MHPPNPQCPDQLHYPGLSSVNVSELPHPNPQCPDQIPSLGSATNSLPTPHVRTGVLPNLVEKQSLKKEVATQTEEHLPPFELAPSSTWQIVETCIGELMFGPRGYSLLPPELFQEIEQHIQELKKCRFLLMSRCYKTVEIVSSGRSMGEGAGGVHPPPRDDRGFSNTNGILPKKKLCGLLVLKKSKRRVHPLLKKILNPPLVCNEKGTLNSNIPLYF